MYDQKSNTFIENKQCTARDLLRIDDAADRNILLTEALDTDKKLVFDGTTVKNAIGYSGLNKAPSFQIAVSSFKGETTVTSLVQCSKGEKEKADLILDTIIREIESFA